MAKRAVPHPLSIFVSYINDSKDIYERNESKDIYERNERARTDVDRLGFESKKKYSGSLHSFV